MWNINIGDLVSQGEKARERLASALKIPQESSPSKEPQAQDKDKATSTTATASPDKSNEASSSGSTSKSPEFSATIAAIPTKNEEMLQSLKTSWGNVLTATKEVTKQAVDTLEKEQTRIQARVRLFHKNGPYKRDLSLPLDTESLRDAEVVYITDRLIAMGHPAMQSAVDGDITPDRKLASVAHLLQKRHEGKYMVWNLSELEYDYSVLDDQVMTFEFPGSPSPPLGLLMKILMSIESWLKADERNVAVMHCLTGRGRTSTVMATFLCWMGEAGFVNPNKALEYMAQCKKLDLETLTIPSQRRYVGYFSNMLDGVRPNQPPLVLKRIIMSEAPKFEKYQIMKKKDSEGEPIPDPLAEHEGKPGCSPYLQVFKAGKLVFTTAASKSFNQSKNELPFCFSFENSITFPCETVVQGDILIRCRHLTRRGQRVSMFRAAMHTGYVPPKVMRLRKSDIDGACSDKRYGDDFFIDLVFEECSASMASKHLLSSPAKGSEDETDMKFKQDANATLTNEASMRRMAGTVAGAEGTTGSVTVTASAYDSMLHRDSRFWDVIAQRREEKRKVVSVDPSNSSSGSGGEDHVPSVYYGPTIGRRRQFPSEKNGSKSSRDGEDSGKFSAASQKSSLHSFTIGGELDFTLEDDDEDKEKSSSVTDAPTSGAKDRSAGKKDDLMDALMAIDDLEEDDDDAMEADESPVVVEKAEVATAAAGAATTENVKDSVATTEKVQSTGMTEEIVFESSDAESSNKPSESLFATKDAKPAPAETQSEGSEKPPSDSDDLVNLDDLNLEDLDKNVVGNANANADDGEDDDFDEFDDDDDDELADLEEFLMKAAG